MKYLKRLVLSALCLLIFGVLFSVTAFAERQIIEWDGKSALESGNTYIITETVKLKKSIEMMKFLFGKKRNYYLTIFLI